MKITLPPNARLFIIEGIPGSGKDTLQHQLEDMLLGRTIYDYSEGELLFSWKHPWIENIDEIRLNFMEHFLNYCENTLAEDRNAVFILNRFHISYLIFLISTDSEIKIRYAKVIEQLKKLPTFVFAPILDKKLIETRSAHQERTHPVWTITRNKRLQQRGCSTFQKLYTQDQNKIIALLKEQNIPHQLVRVDLTTK